MRRLAPVLAQLNQMAGVAASYASESGGLVRVTLRRGANGAAIAAQAQRLLRAHVNDRTPVRVGALESVAQIATNQWRDEARVSELAIEVAQSEQAAAGRWILLILACLVGASLLFGWWRRRNAAVRSTSLAVADHH